MTDDYFYKFDTMSVHAGQRPDPVTGARAVPIYQTTSYVFDDTQHAAALFNLEVPGHIYSRISNPTTAVFEERMAALEGGVGAIGTASGQGALHLAIATLVSAGEEIVSSTSLYGGSYNLLLHTMPRFGINTVFVDPADPENFRRAITPRTRLVFGETIGNPRIDVLDLQAVADIAHEAGVPMLVDSTFATPYLCRPIEHGVDLLVHSATKFIGGHGTTIAGVLVDAGRFDWKASGRFPVLTDPYEGYHGVVFAEEYGPLAFIMKARLEGLRDFGPVMSATSAFYLLQGLETLPLRMERHVDNTRRVVKFLVEHEAVSWVSYPELEDHPSYQLGKKYLPQGAGAVLTFGIKGGFAAGVKFIESLELFSHLANVGDAKSLVIHPASTTHQQMSPEQLAKADVGEDMIR
ncbi:MAG: O-acetylhomoserine aminocarboxypropyltransferase, partial [SAR324 cluster bacterium]|nr:O-acetylhomoserine aminocarboxypropyltransferase [SAR324 cluster bacterium]